MLILLHIILSTWLSNRLFCMQKCLHFSVYRYARAYVYYKTKKILFYRDGAKKKEKSEKDINGEIKAVIRQITATVTFLPLIETACE